MKSANNATVVITKVSAPILRAAEKLYALHGIDAVSTRQIAREAGQKNHSAVQYHFGSAEGLLEAILDYRMLPLNTRREQLLHAWEAQGKQGGLRALVSIMVSPLVDELQRPIEDSYYLSLLMQLSTRGQFEVIVNAHSPRSQALWRVHRHLRLALADLDDDVSNQRQSMMGRQLITTIADWDRDRRQSAVLIDDELLAHRKNLLLDFIVGGLGAPVSVI
jgi:AcrR family transcriptional regulator